MSDNTKRKPGAGELIADRILGLILNGQLAVDERLPGEQDLAGRFGVSRPTIREALKTLAARNLIRTRRGAAGGSFVNRYGLEEAREQIVATMTILMSVTRLPPETVLEARQTFLAAIAPLACARRDDAHLARMREEIAIQRAAETDDEAFCASDVRFLRALTDAAGNPLVTVQMAAVIEALEPLLNMLTWRGRDRAEIAARHARIVAMLERRNADGLIAELARLSEHTAELILEAQARRGRR